MDNKIKPVLEKLREEFYEWCRTLSLDELASNTDVIERVEQVERLLLNHLGGLTQ